MIQKRFKLPDLGGKKVKTAEQRLEQIVKASNNPKTGVTILGYYPIRELRRMDKNNIGETEIRGECRRYIDGFEAVLRETTKYDGRRKYIVSAILHVTKRGAVLEYTAVSSEVK